MTQAQELTQLLHAWQAGDGDASAKLFETVYPQLKQIAARHMCSENAGHTLQSTALINEAYERLLGSNVAWQDRQHFLCILSTLMRRVLVDHARAKARDKRGGGQQNITLNEEVLGVGNQFEIIDIDDALNKYKSLSKRGAAMMEMRVFAGMENQQIADAIDTSVKTVEREIRSAKAWLFRELKTGS